MLKKLKKLKDCYEFGKDHGFVFAIKYKTGKAKEGIDFVSIGKVGFKEEVFCKKGKKRA